MRKVPARREKRKPAMKPEFDSSHKVNFSFGGMNASGRIVRTKKGLATVRVREAFPLKTRSNSMKKSKAKVFRTVHVPVESIVTKKLKPALAQKVPRTQRRKLRIESFAREVQDKLNQDKKSRVNPKTLQRKLAKRGMFIQISNLMKKRF